jgi:hypothetical protein
MPNSSLAKCKQVEGLADFFLDFDHPISENTDNSASKTRLAKMPPMMRFSCPHCQKKINVAPEGVGRTVSYPRCRTRLIIPSPINEESASDKPVSGQTGISTKPR